MTLSPLRVAVASAAAVAGDLVANVRAAATLMHPAADAGARIVVLPELFLPGYDIPTLAADADGCDITDFDDVRLDPLRAASVARNVIGLVGASVRLEGRRTIAVLAFVDGQVHHAYDKQHLWGEEATVFAAGRSGATVHVDGWPLGLAVCYDGCFPEHARAAADDGALGYLVPAAYLVGSDHRRDLYYAARALDNGMYVALAGLVGRCGSGDFSGGSAVYDPEGQAIVRVVQATGVAVADLDPQRVCDVRAAQTMGRDRLDGLGTPANHRLA